MRYAFGIDEPGPAGRDRLPVFGTDLSGNGSGEEFLTITFTRGEGRSDVTFYVETSGDLVDWRQDAVWIRREELDDGSTADTYRDVTPVGEEARRFLRVRVNRE